MLVSLACLLVLVAAANCIAGSDQEITVLTHYCPWYEPVGGNWQDGITATPLLGLYRSTDPAMIAQHIQWANAYGIDCFVVEWSGLRNPQYNNNLKIILQHPDASKIKFSLVYAASMALGTVWDQSEPPERMRLERQLQRPRGESQVRQRHELRRSELLVEGQLPEDTGKPRLLHLGLSRHGGGRGWHAR